MVGVSLPGFGTSIASMQVSLTTGLTIMAWGGESFFGVQVSLVGITHGGGGGSPGQVDFSKNTNSGLVPVLVGFA